MHVYVDLAAHLASGQYTVTQTAKEPPVGTAVSLNGRFILPTVQGIDFNVNSTSYVLDAGGLLDGADITSVSFAHLLAAYPQFGNLYFNPLLVLSHVAELDPAATFHEVVGGVYTTYACRYQSGSAVGVMPTHTALLPANAGVTPTRPGMLITDEIDISAFTGAAGTDSFLPYWRLFTHATTADVVASFGALSGTNSPAIHSVVEGEQEPTDFKVYLTTDNGSHWTEVHLLETVAFCDKTTKFRLAFRNDSAAKIYIGCFALLF